MDEATKIRELLCPKEEWVNDKEVSKCKNCQRNFVPIFVWKHHCRFCGAVFCSDCVSNIMSGQSIGYTVEKRLRYCNACRIRINMVKKDGRHLSRKSSASSNNETNLSMLEIEEPDLQVNSLNSERKTHESVRNLIIQQRVTLESLALSLLRQLSHQLCEKYKLEMATWELRLTQMAWKAVMQTKPGIFMRKTPFNLLEEIRIITIVSPNEAVAAACVKGLVIEKTIPTKQLQTHMKYPRIITVKPAIEADSLMKNKQVRFDEIVLNEDKYLRGYMQSLFRLNPTIVFVEGNVSRGALDLALEHNVMMIPKVKNEDLLKIERLSLIKRRIENLLFIDKNHIAEIIGCCQRVYFKNVRQGQTLLFVEHEAGMRTVLLGDTSQASNENLKQVFNILLRAAWNLKIERELASRDIKLSPDNIHQSKMLVAKTFFLDKYLTSASFQSSQRARIFKMRYCQAKMQNLSKPFQEYCKLRGRKGMLDPCGDICWAISEMYWGQELNLGSFLLKCCAETAVGCERCDGQHVYRFYLDNYVVNVSCQSLVSWKLNKITSNFGQEEQQEQSHGLQDFDNQNPILYSILTKFIKAWKEEQLERHPKLFFTMFFKCEQCNYIIGNPALKSTVGNDVLIMSLPHFIYVIVNAYRNYERSQKDLQMLDQTNCHHSLISRVFQCPRTLVKFTITKIQRSEILPIVFNEQTMKKVLKKDASMVSELFLMMISKKKECIESIEKEMEELPFSGGTTGMAASISIAGNSAVEHSYFWPYMKVGESLTMLKESINQIQQNLGKQIDEGAKDWTILLRKFSKMDHVIKASREIILFIANALKKQKIEENTQQLSSSMEEQMQLINFSLQEKMNTSPNLRKFSEQPFDIPMFKSQSNTPSSPYSTFSASRLRKQTSVSLETEFDEFLKRMRKSRYLRYQGAYLYYPIGNIDDAVSLLACCLNSDQFKEGLKQGHYSDTITTKISFSRELQTDWPPTPTIIQIYKDLLKQDFYSGQTQQVEFWTYYHKQFQELRVSEKIDFRLYVRSLFGCQNWDSSGGKSNSSFSKSHNQTLVVKIINEKQFVEFQKFAPAYLKYMKAKRQNKEESYLAKIFGIYEVIIKNKVYKCVVMQNVFFGLDLVGTVYDLKGSQVNRLAQPTGDKAFTRLDTNFLIDRDSVPYLLQPSVYEKTVYALTEDANFLRDQGVIDYSLLAIESGVNLRMGIIDFMRPYHFVEKIQTLYKQIKSGKDPTVIPPQQYAQRFIRAIRRYFAKSTKLSVQFDQ